MTRRILVTGGSGFIGTNLVDHFRAQGDLVVNLDRDPPRDPTHARSWESIDLLDGSAVVDAVRRFGPTHVVHLAARTDLDGTSPDDYRVNVDGTAHLLDALHTAPELRRTIIASSMLVCRNGYVPRGPDDYCPTTPYGASKRDLELLVRSRDDHPAPWVIVRPTSIWGPWFGEPYRPFVEAVRRGRYVHPGRRRVHKALGYVGNLAFQVDTLLASDRFDRDVVYLCDDPPYSIGEWADALADGARRARPRHVPVPLLALAARAGDLARRSRLVRHPPLTSFRLANMLTESRFDIGALTELTGPLPHPLADGVARTLAWLDDQT